MGKVGEHVVRELFGLQYHLDTVVTSWIVMAALVTLCLIALLFRQTPVRDFLNRLSGRLSSRRSFYVLAALVFLVAALNITPVQFSLHLSDGTAFSIVVGLALAMLILHGGRIGLILEATFKFLRDMVTENMPKEVQSSFNFIATLFLFILFSNMLGLLRIPVIRLSGNEVMEFKSPTADVNVTLGLALLVLAATVYYGCKALGVKKYLLGYFQPNPVFFPIHLIDTLIRPFSLAFRLFGNIFAGEVLLMILYYLLPVGVPVVWLAFSIFVGVIQAYLFAMLSIAYISAATNH